MEIQFAKGPLKFFYSLALCCQVSPSWHRRHYKIICADLHDLHFCCPSYNENLKGATGWVRDKLVESLIKKYPQFYDMSDVFESQKTGRKRLYYAWKQFRNRKIKRALRLPKPFSERSFLDEALRNSLTTSFLLLP